MKRANLRKVKPVSCSSHEVNTQAGQSELSPPGAKRRTRTSAAMIGLALSMGATSLLLPRQASEATAAEPPLSDTATTVAPSVTQVVSPLPGVESAATSTVRIVEHVVREGQTLQQLAAQYQVSIEEIAAANDLKLDSTLRIGQIIQIPVPADGSVIAQADVISGSVPESAKAELSSPLIASADLNQVPSVDEVATGDRADIRTERNNALDRLHQQRDRLRDSLAGLRYEELSDLAMATPKNEAESGMQSQETAKPSSMVEPPQTELNPVQDPVQVAPVIQTDWLAYRVQPGDTLGSIARIYNVSPETIGSVNELANPDWLQISQSLKIPVQPVVEVTTIPPGSEPGIAPPVAFHPDGVSSSDSPAQPTVPQLEPADFSQPLTYQVNPGDTIAAIARAYNIPQSLLIDANRLSDPNTIFVGQVLTVPAAQPTNQTDSSVTVPSSATIVATNFGTEQFVPESSTSSVVPNLSQTGPQTVNAVTVPTVPSAPVLESQTILPTVVSPESVGVVPSQPEAQSVEVAQSIAVASPDPAPPAVDSPAQTDLEPESSSLESDSTPRYNSYVENLLSELRAMRQRNRQDTTVNPQPPAPLATVSSPASPTNPTGEFAVNPQFSRVPNSGGQTTALQVSSPESQVADNTQSDAVAVAPLGSESYDPLLQPLTGRMVAPELPPLPGADTFLPEGSEIFNGYIWPTRGILTSGYGWRWGRMHQGIDIASDIGTPVHTAANGVVEYAGWNSGGYGNMVEVRHADGSMTRYAHLNAIYVEAGQNVDQGEQVGEMGSTGYSTGPHLHFEVHLPDVGTVNPISYLPAE
ncbi:MAG: LysM peptidoglycan-binding domain-containing protein [Cyanobacteria bacterium RU_5_0]|nr:LysM peptidoglycan-binding domain-containing protein [Cyanobacteria bacterium RU_5_0]